MRFRSLHLEAFGPFTRELLDLSGGAPGGLHVIYGPNEAGKSTSLRAVEGLLFGIPERSTDAHLHSLKNLAVAAVLERGDGAQREELRVTRRKRRKDSLVDAEGQPLPDDALAPWLGGLDQRSFFARFGLDQARLEQGAEALLGGSEEGLFAAGTAGPDVARLLSRLQAEEEALYGVRAKRPLNRALTTLTEAARVARQAARPPEKWREQKRAHDQALARVEVLRTERGRLKLEQGRLNRLAAVRSDVARWVHATEELEQLGPQRELPEDAEARRAEAQRAQRDGQRELARLGGEIEELSRRLGELPAPSTLLEVEAERWEALEKKIGWEHKAREDRPKLEGKLVTRLDELGRHLARIGRRPASAALEVADELRVESAVERRARRATLRYAQLELAASEATRQLNELRRDRTEGEAAAEALPPQVDVDALEVGLGRARQAHARSERAGALRQELAQLHERAERLAREVRVSLRGAELLAALPAEGEVLQARKEAEALEVASRRLQESRSEQQARHDEAIAALRAQDLAGEVPSEAKLAELRRQRDELMARLEPILERPADIRRWAEQLTALIGDVDHVADRLRLEAHRVSERDKHLQVREAAQVALDRIDAELATLDARAQGLRDRWAARWETLRGPLPELTELPAIRGRLLELGETQEQITRLTAALATLQEEAREVARLLAQASGVDLVSIVGAASTAAASTAAAGVEVDLGALVELSAQRLAAARQGRERALATESRLKELELRIARQRDRAEEAERELEQWRAEWQQILQELGLPEKTPPDEVQAVLAELAEVERVAEDARDKQRRLGAIDQDSRSFGALVGGLVERHASELAGLDTLEGAVALLERVRRARDVERERQRLREELEVRRASANAAKQAVAVAWAALQELMEAAHVDDPAELVAVEQQVRRARELRAQRAQLEDVLRGKAAAGSLEELIAEARAISSLELSAQCEELEARLDDLEEELRAAEYDASAKGAGLELYGSEDAAHAEQQVASAAAETRQVLRDFLVLRTARVLLAREVARYAERHQGPILARANEYFPRLTLGRYSGLRVGVGERTLRCVREGAELELTELSRGTRAQLYLALRLASLEHYFEGRAPVPLVFDDLLVDFDDDRACAAFELLGELAERVQVLYFTHLGRDLHAARDAVPSHRLFEHRIGVLPAVAQPA